jgi:predicted ATP-binding protein involved in virulence
MRITELTIRNFRGIKAATIEFPFVSKRGRTTVLLGVNGAGKTAVLDCLAILLSQMAARVRSGPGVLRQYSELDVRRGQVVTTGHVTVKEFGQAWSWSRSKRSASALRRHGGGVSIRGGTRVPPDGLRGLANALRDAATDDPENPFPMPPPFAVYYPTNRAVLDIPLRIRQRHPLDQLSAYDHALTGASANFRVFFEWFRNREDIENEERVSDPGHRDRQLEAVRRAVKAMPVGLADLRVRRSPLRMVVTKGNEELRIDQLSDGEKCLFALTGDLARRLAIAAGPNNPPLDTPAVVLIDEVDLHLHPQWQRQVVPCLEAAFPNCQFIVSTMSPLVVSQVQPEYVRILRREGDRTEVITPERTFGLDANRVLEEVMDGQKRPPKVAKRIEKLFDALAEGGDGEDKALRLLDALRREIGDDPELAEAEAMLDLRRRLRK